MATSERMNGAKNTPMAIRPKSPKKKSSSMRIGVYSEGDDRRAGLKQIARHRQRVGKADRLELTRRIRKTDEGEFVAGFRAALLAMSDGTGELGGGSPFERLFMEGGPGVDTELRQGFHIFIERMSGKIEPDRLVFLCQPLHRQPWLALRE